MMNLPGRRSLTHLITTLFTGLFLLTSVAAWGRTVIDQRNIVVEIPDHVSRVVTITIPMASMIITLDESSEKLVAINRSSHIDFKEGFLSHIYPEVVNIPYDIASDGFVPNVENLARLHPDVIIQWGDHGDTIIKPLKNAGFPVITTLYGETRYVADWMKILGNVIGKPQRGNDLANWFNQQYDHLEKQSQQFANNKKPGVLHLSSYNTGFSVAGKGSHHQGDITLAGGRNLAEDLSASSPVNLEQLILWNPDVILLNNFEKGLTPEKLYHDARLQNLSAIVNKRIYIYPRGGYRWDPPSQESILSLEWLSLVLHPEINKGNFRQKIKDTYKLLYNYIPNDNDIDSILRLKENSDAPGYCALFCKK